MKDWLRYTAVSLISFAVSLTIAEYIYGYFEPPEQLRAINTMRERTVRYDPIVGWANKEGSTDNFITSAFHTHVSINEEGMRDKPVGEKKKFRVAVIGDSMVWGWGVDVEDRFTEALENRLNIEILNIGSIGYSTIQYYLLMDKALLYNPDLIVVAFTLYNDFNVVKNLETKYYRPYGHIRDGKLEILGYPIPDYRTYANVSGSDGPYITRFALGRLFYFVVQKSPGLSAYLFPTVKQETPNVLGVADYNNELLYHQPDAPPVQVAVQVAGETLKRIKTKLDEKNMPFAIYALDNRPTVRKGDLYIKLLRGVVDPLGIPMVATYNQMGDSTYFIKGDSHFSPKGHQRAADILQPRLADWIKEIRANGKISSDIAQPSQ